MRRSTSTARRACAVGTTIALVGLTTGLGIMTATSASAVEPTTSTAVADGGTTSTVAPSTDSPSTDTPGTEAPATGTPTSDAPATEAPSTAAPTTDAPATETPATVAPTPSEGDEPTGSSTTADRPAAAGTVTIDGVAAVGSKLTAEPSGFTAPANLSYSWTVDGTSVSQGQSYVVKPTDAGKVVMVTVTNTQGGIAVESESAQTDPITQAPVFVDEDGKPVTDGITTEGDLTLTATAGEAFSYTFRAIGSPKPVLALDYYNSEDGEDADGWTPADQLPEGISFDPATGVLSGTTVDASYWDFAVTATSGTETVTQTVELDVRAAAPVGLEATAVDRADFIDYAKAGFPVGWFDDEATKKSGSLRSWIIKADGSVVTEHTDWEQTPFGGSEFIDEVPGGTPTVPQGGTLLLSGTLVDEFGNAVEDEEDDLGVTSIDVRSNVASDVVEQDSLLGDSGFVGVTFPHASVHRLTVSASDFSTAFDVQVTPTPVAAVPGGTTTPAAVQHGTASAPKGHGRLAYTGADETSPIAWALGLLVAGAGLIGARTLRRRRARS